MRHPGHQHHVEQLRDHQHHHSNLHRGADVLAGVVARRQHLDGDQAQQTRTIARQGHGDLPHIAIGQLAVVEQRGHEWLRKGQQRHGTRHGQQHHHAQAPVEHGRIARAVVRRLGRCQLRCQHHAQCHPQQCGGKFHQAVGIKQPGHAAGRQVRSDLGVDHQRELRHPHPQQRGRHERQDAAHLLRLPRRAHRAPGHANARQQAQAVQHGHLRRQLQHTAQHHAASHGVDGLHPARGQQRRAPPGGHDHAQIQQHGGGGRHGKALPGIEHPGRQCHHGHEADVGEHPARHEHGGVVALGVLPQAAGQQPHEHRRTQHAQHAGQHQGPGQGRCHAANEHARGFFALLGLGGGEHGHEGLAEGAFGKQTPKQIGNAKGDVEGVGQRVGAKDRGHEQVAHQPRHTGSQRQQGDGGSGFEQCHGAQCMRCARSARHPARRHLHPPWLGGL